MVYLAIWQVSAELFKRTCRQNSPENVLRKTNDHNNRRRRRRGRMAFMCNNKSTLFLVKWACGMESLKGTYYSSGWVS